MQTNFLEELAAEWLEHKGYLVKRSELLQMITDHKEKVVKELNQK